MPIETAGVTAPGYNAADCLQHAGAQLDARHFDPVTGIIHDAFSGTI
jgi:hypothetical protein